MSNVTMIGDKMSARQIRVPIDKPMIQDFLSFRHPTAWIAVSEQANKPLSRYVSFLYSF